MSSNRFYLNARELVAGAEIELPETISRQVSRVLRMREGQLIRLFNGTGNEWRAEIVSVNKNSVSVLLEEPVELGTEPRLDVTVCQALVPADRMEYVVQKSTELGALRIIPVITERVQARDANPGASKLERWRRIAIEASEQSGRTRVPEILPVQAFDSCLSQVGSDRPMIVLWEEERQVTLRQALQESLSSEPNHVAVFVGPVGGLSVDEARAASAAGALLAGAGPRILRAETAPVVALTALMYEAGELGTASKTENQ